MILGDDMTRCRRISGQGADGLEGGGGTRLADDTLQATGTRIGGVAVVQRRGDHPLHRRGGYPVLCRQAQQTHEPFVRPEFSRRIPSQSGQGIRSSQGGIADFDQVAAMLQHLVSFQAVFRLEHRTSHLEHGPQCIDNLRIGQTFGYGLDMSPGAQIAQHGMPGIVGEELAGIVGLPGRHRPHIPQTDGPKNIGRGFDQGRLPRLAMQIEIRPGTHHALDRYRIAAGHVGRDTSGKQFPAQYAGGIGPVVANENRQGAPRRGRRRQHRGQRGRHGGERRPSSGGGDSRAGTQFAAQSVTVVRRQYREIPHSLYVVVFSVQKHAVFSRRHELPPQRCPGLDQDDAAAASRHELSQQSPADIPGPEDDQCRLFHIMAFSRSGLVAMIFCSRRKPAVRSRLALTSGSIPTV